MNLIPITLSSTTTQTRKAELLQKISAAPNDSLILASELCVSGYDFDGFFAGKFDAMLLGDLQTALTPDKFLAFTHLTSTNKAKGIANVTASKPALFNEFILLNSNEIYHTQAKSKLFLPNKEQEIFSSADESEVKIFDFLGLKVGVLICFEIRFSELWARLKGCDIVLVPTMWGGSRADDFKALCKALAIINNCYVVTSSSLDLEFTGVFLPDAEFKKETKFELEKIKDIKKKLGLI
ncbi:MULTISPECIES: carbon-nitrogen hydrolase family protein [unclassified Campylobacter]|uniref:carbon-nitrogen hydrolase family protein n=1 Tax=unclassified Campylobacter TaxID=2593542 RepID=UPI003D34772E